ncbi:hypothetical protein Bpfe_024185 [Biomphalaria pfeifferi]|uniref:Uncharacterized protein n=1 Tax=Biomphalaria pfeifferi TaxID=112525 RepID=A0AAD8B4D1_BIOPF|nr:hypothetical protein Bpfe_024185 [Biomphalaria pfeifferi]
MNDTDNKVRRNGTNRHRTLTFDEWKLSSEANKRKQTKGCKQMEGNKKDSNKGKQTGKMCNVLDLQSLRNVGYECWLPGRLSDLDSIPAHCHSL